MDKTKAAKIMEENMKTIFAYALNRVQDRTDAEDLAGEIIVTFLASADKLRDDRAVFGYIWTIAANTTSRFLAERSKAFSHRAEFYGNDEGDDSNILENIADPEGEDFTHALERCEEIMTLRRELSILAKEYRECTVAYYFDGLSCREIAAGKKISTEMVKYYLYKTRRILKEGMKMTREFGEKSYRPATFSFNTIFEGMFNREYRNLFDRKLPGNIMYSAYYTPMTVGELSVELGVSAVYLEDEIELLKKYDLLTEVPGGRYQTKLCIFTEAYDREFHRAAEERFTDRLGTILGKVKKKLPVIREMQFPGCGMSDNRLMWALYFKLLSEGNRRWKRGCNIEYAHEIYSGARGVNYAEDYEDHDSVYSCSAFAGFYGGIGSQAAACMADFGVLGEKNFFGQGHNWERAAKLINLSVNGGEDAPIAYFMPNQVDRIYDEILADEVGEAAELYRDLTGCAAEVMQNHVPKAVRSEVDAVLKSTIFHRTVGLMGKIAVDTGVMSLPDDDLPCAVFLFPSDDSSGFMKGNCSD